VASRTERASMSGDGSDCGVIRADTSSPPAAPVAGGEDQAFCLTPERAAPA
jgi:hypothetical protein